MKRIIPKVGVIWLTYSSIFICLTYWLQGDSIALIPFDIRCKFLGNRAAFYAIVIFLTAITFFCFYAVMNEMKLIRFRWDIRIGRFHKKLGTLKYFYLNINWILVVGCVLQLLLLWAYFFYPAHGNNRHVPDDSWTSYPIAHAMGAIDGFDYTNSLEAFELNYALGHRVFEVDFSVTSDGEMVCSHDWYRDYQEGIDKKHIPTKEVFKSTPILGEYTPLTFKELLLLMREYEDIYIVTDTKTNKKEALEQFEFIYNSAQETGTEDVLDRIIVQIYNNDMYEWVKEAYDFPTIIYTLYASDWDKTSEGFVRYCRFCKNNDISYITMWWYLATPEVLEIAKSYDISVFVHTVNDLDKAEALIKSGVKGVYTDELTPDMLYGRIK